MSQRFYAVDLNRCVFYPSQVSWGVAECISEPEAAEPFIRCLFCGLSQVEAVKIVRELNAGDSNIGIDENGRPKIIHGSGEKPESA